MSGCKDCRDCRCPDDEDTLDEPLPVRYVCGGKCVEPDMTEVKSPTDAFAVGDLVTVPSPSFGETQEGEVVAKTHRHLKVRLTNGMIRLFEPRFVERVVIAFLSFVVAFLLGCEGVDYGRLEDPFGGPLCPIVTPLYVVSEESLYEDVSDAAVWWNDEVFPEVLFESLPGETEETIGVVTVAWGSLDAGQGGEASVDWRCVEEMCEITHTDIVIQTGLDPALLQPVLRHELGHSVGLADDDLWIGSIMQTPSTTHGGSVTAHDLEIILDGCE